MGGRKWAGGIAKESIFSELYLHFTHSTLPSGEFENALKTLLVPIRTIWMRAMCACAYELSRKLHEVGIHELGEGSLATIIHGP